VTRNRMFRSWLMVALVLFAVGFTTACATYSSDYYDSTTGTYYRSDNCRPVHTVVTENGVVVNDTSRVVCSVPGYYRGYYYDRY
jgi:1,4-dihydroxy-2-naphthoate octaprenyltransferase